MARRRRVISKVREVAKDSKYGSVLVSKIINTVMMNGRRALASRIVYKSLEDAAKECGQSCDIVKFAHAIIDNVSPKMEVRSRRVGGATYQVPMEVSAARAQAVAIRWLVGVSRATKRSGLTKDTKYSWLSGEFVDAFRGVGAAVKKKNDTHKMAEANRAFSHYRWS